MTTVLTTPPNIDTAVADLILVRMILPSKRPAAPKVVRQDVGKLLHTELPDAHFHELRSELASAGLLTSGKRNTFTVSDAGRRRALHFLGVAELPSPIKWSTVIARYVFPKAAGTSPAEAAALNSGDKLTAHLLKKKYELPAGAGSSVNQVLEAIVCKELGFTQETTLNGLMCAVLSELLGSERLTKEKLVKQLPLFQTGLAAVTADAVRGAVVRDWLTRVHGAVQRRQAPVDETFDEHGETGAPKPPVDDHFDLPDFAATVHALAAHSQPEDRFHDNKVFIAALWRAAQREPNFPHLSLPQFKQRLVEANSQNLLHLSRADLVQAMEPHLVSESETVHLNATFHFVLIERVRP